jgi:hypothetical protein
VRHGTPVRQRQFNCGESPLRQSALQGLAGPARPGSLPRAVPIGRRREQPSGYVENLYQNLAAHRNQLIAEVKQLESELAEKKRELRSVDEAARALKAARRR